MTYNTLFAACLWKKQVLQLTDITHDSYTEFIKQFPVPVESVGGDRQVKPYIDTDPVMSPDYTDEDWEIDILNNKLSILECFPEISIEDIRCIKRKYEVKDGVKYSVHYIVDKIRMSACNMPSMFKALNLEGFDESVYDKNRFLTSIYTDKKVADGKTKSLPMFMPDGCDDIKHYLVSYIEEGFVDYDLKFPKREVEKPKHDNNFLQQINKGYEDEDLVKKLVECLSVKRADEYGDWLNVGFCLYCISNECLSLWDDFSQKSDKYQDGVCEKQWYKMSNKGYSIGTLKYWAKLDNEKLYKKIMAECLDKYVEITIGSDGAHYDIAVITSKLMADKAVYDGQMKAWFFVDERTNLWETDKDGTFLRKIFAVDVIKVFLKASHNYSKLAFECEQQFKTGYEEKSKKSLNIAKQLKNASFCDSLLKCCKCTLMNKGFFEKFIDKKVELFAFNNCVFDCDMKKFRPIEPTDYIMTTTGYDYNSNVEQKYIDELMDILNAIQPNTENLHYLLDTLSSRLYGKNLLQLFFIWTGVGANGKSVIGNLLDSAFGGYFGKIGADTITKPTKNANSTSEFSRVSGCRCVIVEEPDEGDKLQVSMLKEHSGDSKIRTRGLFQESYEYTPQYAITIYCNEIPELSKVGGHSIARRLRVIHFPTKFCESPSKPMEKLGDNELNKRLSGDIGYKHALIKILIDNWCNKDLKRKIETPSCILESSKEYMDNCNYVKKFLDERYEYSEYDKDTNKDAKVRSSELYELFKMTYKDLKMTDKTFKTLVEAEGYTWLRMRDSRYFLNLKRREDVEEE